MDNNLTDKDKRDWNTFLKSKDKLPNKDIKNREKKKFKTQSLDLHGYTLEKANVIVESFINKNFKEGTNKLVIVTGKGLHSKNEADPFVSKEEMFKKGIEKLDFYDLATQSDFVVVLCNLNKDTEGLVNIEFLKKMKKNAFFINMSRGPVVNEKDLIFVLEKNLIAGAGLDVFNEEPINKNNKLLNLKNTILTPHALCWTDECFDSIATEAIASILNYFNNKKIINRVV